MKLNEQLTKLVEAKFQEEIKNLPLKELPYFKNGGKAVRLSKKGGKNKIHIKEENKGKFTSYCGGTVTSECIAKGKRSPNPAIRKRATFAANARKWNH